ncbi:uncharacterized protein LOC129742522 [Uranotaenia lowii]|uniref:uncharacterized protein LOC129742522 n=1 Tax=Uranotaenia lowii TaxID=190385 RepID=UPI00247AD03B|nr:uncharacterized protein LOC129742522 [Uranotaenia lowii]
MAESFPPWGAPPVPPNRYSRTLPRWMDPSDLYGEVQFLVLKPAKDHQLPKNPFTISKSIDQSVGRIDGASPFDGGKSILLRVRSQQQCEKLLQLRNLIDGTPITVEPHPTKNTCQSVVSCQDVAGLSDADICEALQDQKVVKVYRFTRKDNGKSIPTNTMVLTFSGTVPPTHVWFGYLRVSTRPYYPRPMQCFQCGRFGHTKAKCPNPAICQNCGEATIHPSCSNLPHCINCLGNHQTTARTCPAYQQEQSIVRIRVDMGISHAEARKEFRSRLNTATQSNVQQRLINAHSTSHNTASKIQELEQQIAELIKKNIELQAQISQMDTEKKNTCDDSDSTLTDASSEASMDTTDISQQLSSTPKRGRGHESPDQTSPVRKMKPKNPSTQTIHVLATPRYDIQPNPNHPSYTALNHPNQR